MGELTSLLGVHSLKYKMPHWRRCLSVQSNTAHNCYAPFMWAAVTGAIAYKPAMPGAYVVTMPTILWAHGSTCTGEAFFPHNNNCRDFHRHRISTAGTTKVGAYDHSGGFTAGDPSSSFHRPVDQVIFSYRSAESLCTAAPCRAIYRWGIKPLRCLANLGYFGPRIFRLCCYFHNSGGA